MTREFHLGGRKMDCPVDWSPLASKSPGIDSFANSTASSIQQSLSPYMQVSPPYLLHRRTLMDSWYINNSSIWDDVFLLKRAESIRYTYRKESFAGLSKSAKTWPHGGQVFKCSPATLASIERCEVVRAKMATALLTQTRGRQTQWEFRKRETKRSEGGINRSATFLGKWYGERDMLAIYKDGILQKAGD
jgi:hypothetical protein